MLRSIGVRNILEGLLCVSILPTRLVMGTKFLYVSVINLHPSFRFSFKYYQWKIMCIFLMWYECWIPLTLPMFGD